MTGKGFYLASMREIEPSARFRRFLAGRGGLGVDITVADAWVGACAVSFHIDGIQHHDVLPSVDEACLVAGLLSAPITGASDIRVLASESAEGSYSTAIEWGRVRLGEVVLRDLLSWWVL